MHKIEEKLWGEVFDIVTHITRYSEEGNQQLVEAHMALLRALHAQQDLLGQPEAFLTEALADYTEDPAEAVALYRLALVQNRARPGEPTHTKRICMASRLVELGDLRAARIELIQGRAEAQRLKDHEYLEMADELLSKLAV